MSSAALWVSKALSYAILVGSLIMQAPQIYKILRARSAKGITTIGWAISVFSMTCNCSYNYRMGYPITTWGEQLSIMVQLELLILLKLHFEDGGLLWRLPLGLALHALVAAACLTRVPAAVLVAVPIPLSCVSTLPQLLTNYRRRSTGQRPHPRPNPHPNPNPNPNPNMCSLPCCAGSTHVNTWMDVLFMDLLPP